MGEEFFAADQYPEITFKSTSFKQSGGDVTIEGDLTIRDNTKPITATGTLIGPSETHAGTRVALDVETTINRQAFGISWEAPALPGGGASLADDVTLEFTLQLAAQE
jgi:polyisoprenoid-binding protein YceI